MNKKIFLKVILILSLIIITWFVYSEYLKKDKDISFKTNDSAICGSEPVKESKTWF